MSSVHLAAFFAMAVRRPAARTTHRLHPGTCGTSHKAGRSLSFAHIACLRTRTAANRPIVPGPVSPRWHGFGPLTECL